MDSVGEPRRCARLELSQTIREQCKAGKDWKPLIRCPIFDLQQCFEHFDDRISQLFDVISAHVRADIKMDGAAQ